MKRLTKIMLVLVLVLSIINSGTVVKADEVAGKIVDGSELTQNNTATAISDNSARGKYLNEGVARVTDNGGGSVNVYGAVIGSVVCDKMILELTLQRYSNGFWINVKSFSNTAYNTSLLAKSYNVSVTKGYYYRVKAACIAQKNGASESKMPVTDGILVD